MVVCVYEYVYMKPTDRPTPQHTTHNTDDTGTSSGLHSSYGPPDPTLLDPFPTTTAATRPHHHQQQGQWEEVIDAGDTVGGLLCNAQMSEDVADFYRRDNPLVRFNRAGAVGARCLPPAWCVFFVGGLMFGVMVGGGLCITR